MLVHGLLELLLAQAVVWEALVLGVRVVVRLEDDRRRSQVVLGDVRLGGVGDEAVHELAWNREWNPIWVVVLNEELLGPVLLLLLLLLLHLHLLLLHLLLLKMLLLLL